MHPAETPSSIVIEALLEFLINGQDYQAENLLDQFQFLIVPMLNPDGVFRGYHKLDALGQDLNRCYGRPDAELQP